MDPGPVLVDQYFSCFLPKQIMSLIGLSESQSEPSSETGEIEHCLTSRTARDIGKCWKSFKRKSHSRYVIYEDTNRCAFSVILYNFLLRISTIIFALRSSIIIYPRDLVSFFMQPRIRRIIIINTSHKPSRRRKEKPNLFILFVFLIIFLLILDLLQVDHLRRARAEPAPEFSYAISSSDSFQDNQPQAFQPTIDDGSNSLQKPTFMALHDSGSGFGYPPIFTSPGPGILDPSAQDLSQSSSVSPSLIAAKCWNNYENTNDCRHLNVITANEASEKSHQFDDDSLITPVVIFESSSSQPTQDQDQTATRSTTKASDRFTTTPSGATILPDLSWPRVRWGPREKNVVIGPISSDIETTRAPITSDLSPVTKRPINVYVATQHSVIMQNKSAYRPIGRKCIDENDSDCDEPDDTGNNIKAGEDEKGEEDIDDSDDDDDENGINSDKKLEPKQPKQSGEEMGSGSGPIDDNEDGLDDPEGLDESSGQSESYERSTTNRYLEVTSVQPPKIVKNSNIKPKQSQATTTTQRAKIEVVVHSTLPPSFPIMTTREPSTNLEESTVQSTTTTTTIMPDDTFKSKPIFPSADKTQSFDENIEDGSINSSETDTLTEDPLSATTDNLNTFKPMPLSQTELPYPGGQLQSTLSSRDRPTPITVRQFLWETGRPTPPGSSGLFDTTLKPWPAWSQNRFPTVSNSPTSSDSNSMSLSAMQQQQNSLRYPQQTSVDNFPTVIVYGLITTLAITACVLMVIAFGIWRKTVNRSRALIQKAHMMNNGFVAPPNQMVPSMSHGSHLVANMQQPSLLNTYGLGQKGQIGKITNSIIKSSERDQIVEEDEMNMMNNDEQQSANSKGEGSFGDSNQGIATSRDQQPGTNNSSWSTEEQTTSSGGSQGSKMMQMNPKGLTHKQLPNNYNQQQRIFQYGSDRGGSDGRQNSESTSDSQDSQIGAGNQDYPMMTMPNQHMYMPHQKTNVPLYPQQSYPMNTSRSVEDFQQQRGLGSMVMGQQHQRMGGYVGQVQPTGDPILEPPYLQSRPMHEQGLIPMSDLMPPPTQTRVNMNGPVIGRLDSRSNGFDYPFQEAGKVPMNVATLGRRFPGMGLNRNILSEDTSSSLVTASPSLARTSSSSSFAFNNHQFQTSIPPPVRPKPIFDSNGRVIHDYTAGRMNGNGSNLTLTGTGPPIPCRKDQSEAWYV